MTSSKKRALVATLLLALVVLAAYFFLFARVNPMPWKDDTQSATVSAENKSVGQGVKVSGQKVPRDLTAEVADIPTAFGSTTPLSKPLEIDPSGLLEAPMTIVIPLGVTPKTGTLPLVATNLTHKPGDWKLLPTQLLPDKRHVSVTVGHLSQFQALQLDLKEFTRIVHEDFVDGLTSGLTKSAKPPACTHSSSFDKLDVTVRGTGALYRCLSREDGKNLLKVTNRMSYPVELKVTGFTPMAQPTVGFSLSKLARQKGHTILEPGEQTAFSFASIKTGQKLTLDVSLSKFSLGLHTVDVMADAFFTLLGKFHMGTAEHKLELVGTALDAKNCLGTLGDLDAGHILANCLTDDVLKEFFDWRFLVIGPVVALLSLTEMSHSLAAAYGDAQVDRTRLHLEIAAQPTGPPSWLQPYTGNWMTVGIYASVTADSKGFFIWWKPDNAGSSFRAYFNVSANTGRAVATITSSEVTTTSPATGNFFFVPGQRYSLDLQPNGVLAFNAIDGDGELAFCSPHMDPTLCGGYIDADGRTHWTGQ